MTPEAFRQTKAIAPAFTARLGGDQPHISLEGQTPEQASEVIAARLASARLGDASALFPFCDMADFSESVLSSPRRLVQSCSVAISEATLATEVPFTSSYLHLIEERLYPRDEPQQESTQ